jgi:AcrR family transcriptional regulator
MNEKQAAAAYTRERLIEAALVVLQQQGTQHLTLDMVAKQAGVSKGGLLHHFPSKDALMEATARHLYECFNAYVEKHYDADPTTPGRWLRAYVRASFEPFDVPFETLVGLFIYGRDSAQLDQLIHDDHALWQERLRSDGVDPVRAAVVRMVCDQYWTERAVNIEQNIAPEALQNYLLSMIP